MKLGSGRAEGKREGCEDLHAQGTTSVPPPCVSLSHSDSPWTPDRPDCLRNEGQVRRAELEGSAAPAYNSPSLCPTGLTVLP